MDRRRLCSTSAVAKIRSLRRLVVAVRVASAGLSVVRSADCRYARIRHGYLAVLAEYDETVRSIGAEERHFRVSGPACEDREIAAAAYYGLWRRPHETDVEPDFRAAAMA